MSTPTLSNNLRSVMPGIDPDDLITISAAAEEKGCSRTTLYRAISDGRLNAVEVGDRRVLVRDETFEAFEPEWKGERVRKYGDEDTDSSE